MILISFIRCLPVGSHATGFWRHFVRPLALVSVLSLLPIHAPVAAEETLTFDGLYQSVGILGVQYTERARALHGKKVRISGHMAPPLKPESRFFVLTREPVAVCPFCASDAEWPVDIVVVYLKKLLAPIDFQQRITVEGKLEIGSWTDPTNGFVSQVRLIDATIER